jgi:uncharacterized protein
MQANGSSPHIDSEAIIKRCYPAGSLTRALLLRHGELVARKALDVLDQAPWVVVDREFVVQAAMLHDIGIGWTRCPELGCTGDLPYVCHGVRGRVVLDEMGLRRQGLVCERHVGVGISADDVLRFNLPLPERDMVPISIEEQIICYADKFFSKNGNGSLKTQGKNVDRILDCLQKYGQDKVHRFQKWVEMFED